MIYQIETKQTSTLKDINFFSKNEVVNTIKMFDLKPPFKVVDDKKNNVTEEFISILEQEGYQFVDINQVINNIPISLQEVMNTFYNKSIFFVDFDLLPIQLVSVKDIKSINGFYELWKNGSITIGNCGNDIIYLDTKTNSICSISQDSIKNLSAKNVISSVPIFINKFKIYV